MNAVNKITCNGCQSEIYSAEAHNTVIGNLCNGCYNLFLDFHAKDTKKKAKSAFFLFFLPSLIWWFLIISIYVEWTTFDTASNVLLFIGIWGLFGAFNITKNGFSEIGGTVRKEYYKATFSSSNEVSISNHSYNGYTSEQWIKMFFNVFIFAFGLALTLFLGPIVYFVKKAVYRKALKEFKTKYNHNLKLSEKKVSESEILSYSGLIAQKALDSQNHNTSRIEGIEMTHIGYLFYKDVLYGAIGSKDQSLKFEKDTVYFIKLFKNTNSYELVDVNSDLYDALYYEYTGISDEPDQEVDAIAQILNREYDGNVFLYNDGIKIEFKQVAVIIGNNDFYAILKPVVPFENMTDDELIVFRIYEDKEGSQVMEIELNDQTLNWVHQQYVKLLED